MSKYKDVDMSEYSSKDVEAFIANEALDRIENCNSYEEAAEILNNACDLARSKNSKADVYFHVAKVLVGCKLPKKTKKWATEWIEEGLIHYPLGV